jgi:hypothetical protein
MRSRRLTSVTSVPGALALVFLACCAALLAIGAPQALAAQKGIIDHRLESSGSVILDNVPGYVETMGPAGLGATWTRVMVRWNHLQPAAPGVPYAGDASGDGYDDHYVTELETVVAALHAQGIRVILSGNDVPKWAANPKYATGKHVTSAVMRVGDPTVMAQFRRFARFCAGHFLPWGVGHFEVWNEPNLASGIYPQIVGKTVVGPAVYLKMLKAFYNQAKQVNRAAVVIAGATSRFGSDGNDPGSTSPQWFARYLKANRAGRWFDAYSHHPYTKRGSDPRPSVPPRQPKKSVTLGNIDVLLRIFPGKPFYLTEFCYSTAPVRDLFCVVVSKEDQARYLRQAYAFAARYPQIKVLLWFLVTDYEKDPLLEPGVGVYTGLVDPAGLRKPSWYAFVGDNALSATAPESAASGARFTVGGVLATKDGPGTDVPVLLQRRGLAGGPWSPVVTPPVLTDAGGAYSFSVAQTSAWQYRVIWDGVAESAPVSVSVSAP